MRTIPLLLATLLIVQSAAAANPEMAQRFEENLRVRKAYAEVIASCAPIERRIAIAPHYQEKKPRELIITRPEWTGGCAGDLAQGEGTMTVLAKTSDGTPQVTLSSRWQGSGLMVKGGKAGPWLIVAEEAGSMVKDQPVQNVWTVGLYQWDDAVYPGYYQRQADGDLVSVTYGYRPGEKITIGVSKPEVYPVANVPLASAATVAMHKQQRLAGTVSGAGATVPVPMLADLLPNGAVTFAPEGPLHGIRGKSAVLLLSKGTAAAFRNIDDMRAQLQAFAEREQESDLRKPLLEMAAVPNSAVLVRDLALVLRRHFKSVSVVPDLRAFQAGQADYAVVLDLQFEHDIGKFFKAYGTARSGGDGDVDSRSTEVMSGTLSMLVLNRQLQVQATSKGPGMWPRYTFMANREWMKSALDGNATLWRMILGSPTTPGEAMLATPLNGVLQMSAD